MRGPWSSPPSKAGRSMRAGSRESSYILQIRHGAGEQPPSYAVEYQAVKVHGAADESEVKGGAHGSPDQVGVVRRQPLQLALKRAAEVAQLNQHPRVSRFTDASGSDNHQLAHQLRRQLPVRLIVKLVDHERPPDRRWSPAQSRQCAD